MTTKKENPLTYGLMSDMSVRAIDINAREAEFVAATEGGVDTWHGKEYLDMDGVDLTRYEKNPVLLDSHNRFEAGAVIGNATVRVDQRLLIIRARFAETNRAEMVWTLVRSGFLRAVSVGFMAKQILKIEEGETYTLGSSVINGPARIVTKWELFENSIVPVPADPDAVRRAYMDRDTTGLEHTAVAFARTLANICSKQNGLEVKTALQPNVEEARTMPTPIEEKPEVNGTPKEVAREAAPTFDRASIDAEIRSICHGYDREATHCIVEKMDTEQARAYMRNLLAEQSPPAGTTGAQIETVEQKREVRTDEILRSIGA